jgi:peroxiredoxin
MLFLEPDQILKLQLPPVREKSFADQKNPYFEPVSFWFATENKQQLNNLISDFTTQLNQVTDKYFDQLYFRQSKSIYDSLVYFIDKKFGPIKNESFVNHKILSLKMVEADAFRLKTEDYSALFNGVKQQFWLHPAFTHIFDKTFKGQLSFEAKSVKDDEIRKAVNQGNISFLVDYTKTKFKVANDMAELALLKMLHDAFYSGDFDKSAIQKMVKSTRFASHKNQIVREAAKNISEKITFLQTGSVAPTICLKNMEGQKTCTNQNNKKFKYIIFADTEMAVCREHLKYLPTIQQKFEKHLEIYVVLRNTGIAEMKKFLSENKITGVKLIDENDEFIELYKVRSFPQCYLLDEYHKVKFAAAKAPLDGFEQQFGSFIQQELFQRQRNQAK